MRTEWLVTFLLIISFASGLFFGLFLGRQGDQTSTLWENAAFYGDPLPTVQPEERGEQAGAVASPPGTAADGADGNSTSSSVDRDALIEEARLERAELQEEILAQEARVTDLRIQLDTQSAQEPDQRHSEALQSEQELLLVEQSLEALRQRIALQREQINRLSLRNQLTIAPNTSVLAESMEEDLETARSELQSLENQYQESIRAQQGLLAQRFLEANQTRIEEQAGRVSLEYDFVEAQNELNRLKEEAQRLNERIQELQEPQS